MKVLTTYVRLYAECFAAGLKGIAKNPWTLLLPIVLLTVFSLLAGAFSGLGLVGGFILGLLLDALLSCYLYFVAEVVANSRISLTEFKQSYKAYFWSILNVGFVLYIARLLLTTALVGNPKGPAIMQVLMLVTYIALNAVPETLYQKGTYGGIDTIRQSFRFLQENWIEWLIPNVLLGYVLWKLFGWAVGTVGVWGTDLLGGAVIHVLMVFRGHLFKALDGTSHRQRMYKLRMGL